MGVKPVLHIAIISSHSLLSLQEVESTAGKTWSQSESSWLIASLPDFFSFSFWGSAGVRHLPLVLGIREPCPIEAKASGGSFPAWLSSVIFKKGCQDSRSTYLGLFIIIILTWRWGVIQKNKVVWGQPGESCWCVVWGNSVHKMSLCPGSWERLL